MSGLFGGNKPHNILPQRYAGIQMQQSTYGQCIPLVYGQNRVSNFLIDYDDFKVTQTSNGGKGGSGQATAFDYHATLLMGICEGPSTGVVGIFANGGVTTLSYYGLTFFSGAGSQAPWSYMTTFHPSKALGYDHTAYVAVANWDMGSSDTMPNFSFEMKGFLQFGGGIVDAEASAIISDYMTDLNHGANFNYMGVMTGPNSFQQYCVAMGFFLSPVEDTQRAAVDFLKETLEICNSAAYVDGLGFVNPVPYADSAVTGNGVTYTPDLSPLFSFTDDDYIIVGGNDPVVVNLVPYPQTYNMVPVEFSDRSNQYNKQTVYHDDGTDIAQRGPRVMGTRSYNSITTAALAKQVAVLLCNRQLYYRVQYVFTVRSDYAVLEPMDLVAVTDLAVDADDDLCRVIKSEENDDGSVTLTVELVPIGPATTPLYNWQAAQGYNKNPQAAPGSVAAPYIFMGPPLLASSQGTPEIWFAVTGPNNGIWAGCDVWTSADNVTYERVGRVIGGARYGTLTTALPDSSSDPDTTNTLSVVLANNGDTLTSGTVADADNLRTLLLVDGEVMAYETATLTGTAAYNLTYLRRAKYGSNHALHASGSSWARLDGQVARMQIDGGLYGQQIFFKFTSFNALGGGEESLSAVTAYSYTLPVATQGANPSTAKWTPRGNSVINGDVFYKGGTTNAWDSDVVTTQSFSRGVAVTARYTLGTALAVGLATSVAGTLDPTVTIGFYGIYANSLSTRVQLFAGTVVLATLATPTVGDQYEVAYDGYVVRYYINGAVLYEYPLQNANLYGGVTFFNGGACQFADVQLQAFALVTPVQFGVVNGGSVSDDVAFGSNAAGYRSGAYSLVSYATCHMIGKLGAIAQSSIHGLMSPAHATTFASYTGTGSTLDTLIDFGWNNAGGTWAIIENGTVVLTLSAANLSDVATITYDGVTINYLLNGVSQHTSVTSGNLYAAVTFSGGTGNQCINSINWGPTTNVALQDTSQINIGAVSSPSSTSFATPTTMGATFQTFVAVTVVVPIGQAWPVQVTGAVQAFLGTTPTGVFNLTQDGTVELGQGWNSTFANQNFSAAFNYTVTLTGGTHTFGIEGHNTSGGATFEQASLQVSFLKR
jgi:hypothetical protein